MVSDGKHNPVCKPITINKTWTLTSRDYCTDAIAWSKATGTPALSERPMLCGFKPCLSTRAPSTVLGYPRIEIEAGKPQWAVSSAQQSVVNTVSRDKVHQLWREAPFSVWVHLPVTSSKHFLRDGRWPRTIRSMRRMPINRLRLKTLRLLTTLVRPKVRMAIWDFIQWLRRWTSKNPKRRGTRGSLLYYAWCCVRCS